MRILLIILLALFTLLQYRLWISEDGARGLWRLNDAVQAQENENRQLRDRNAILEGEVRDLKDGLDAVEERARSDLGMIRTDESFYQLVLDEDGDPPEEGE